MPAYNPMSKPPIKNTTVQYHWQSMYFHPENHHAGIWGGFLSLGSTSFQLLASETGHKRRKTQNTSKRTYLSFFFLLETESGFESAQATQDGKMQYSQAVPILIWCLAIWYIIEVMKKFSDSLSTPKRGKLDTTGRLEIQTTLQLPDFSTFPMTWGNNNWLNSLLLQLEDGSLAQGKALWSSPSLLWLSQNVPENKWISRTHKMRWTTLVVF